MSYRRLQSSIHLVRIWPLRLRAGAPSVWISPGNSGAQVLAEVGEVMATVSARRAVCFDLLLQVPPVARRIPPIAALTFLLAVLNLLPCHHAMDCARDCGCGNRCGFWSAVSCSPSSMYQHRRRARLNSRNHSDEAIADMTVSTYKPSERTSWPFGGPSRDRRRRPARRMRNRSPGRRIHYRCDGASRYRYAPPLGISRPFHAVTRGHRRENQ